MHKRSLLVAPIGALAFMACAAFAQAGEPTIGDRVDQAISKIRSGASEAADRVREGFARVRGEVDELGVEGRVYARLRWDKGLQGASISVEVEREGRTTLTGTAPSEAAKGKAAQLAADTVGVGQVVNALRVVQPKSP